MVALTQVIATQRWEAIENILSSIPIARIGFEDKHEINVESVSHFAPHYAPPLTLGLVDEEMNSGSRAGNIHIKSAT